MRVMSNGRVRRSEAEWGELLARFERQGRSPREFCRKERVALSSLLRWRRRLEAIAPARDFMVLTPAAPQEEAALRWSFELTLPDGRRLRLQG